MWVEGLILLKSKAVVQGFVCFHQNVSELPSLLSVAFTAGGRGPPHPSDGQVAEGNSYLSTDRIQLSFFSLSASFDGIVCVFVCFLKIELSVWVLLKIS